MEAKNEAHDIASLRMKMGEEILEVWGGKKRSEIVV